MYLFRKLVFLHSFIKLFKPQKNYESGRSYTFMSVLQMRKLRPREVKWLTHSYCKLNNKKPWPRWFTSKQSVLFCQGWEVRVGGRWEWEAGSLCWGWIVGSKEVLGVECFFASGWLWLQRFSACVVRDICWARVK